jgi:hypothetical protein
MTTAIRITWRVGNHPDSLAHAFDDGPKSACGRARLLSFPHPSAAPARRCSRCWATLNPYRCRSPWIEELKRTVSSGLCLFCETPLDQTGHGKKRLVCPGCTPEYHAAWKRDAREQARVA